MGLSPALHVPGQPRATATGSPPRAPGMLRHGRGTLPRLLVISADSGLRQNCVHALSPAGIAVVEAGDGGLALAMLTAEPIDLVLLDLPLRQQDGHALCRHIRAMPAGRTLPNLVLATQATLADTGTIDSAFQAGASDVIAIPIHWPLLSHRLHAALRASAAAAKARRTQQRLQRTQQIAHMGHWELVLDSRRFHCAPELVQIYAADALAAGRRTATAFMRRVCAHDRARVNAARLAAAQQGQPDQLRFEVRRFDGVVRTLFEQVVALHDPAAGGPSAWRASARTSATASRPSAASPSWRTTTA